ncbi:hypothetical protein F7R25_04065 [Burkholderia stagnalis]|uniref:Uncharacterized protein n=1 Tax=Burkholderia stagnalis TaxID=1503054 RepID=A0A6L3N3M8_9BURK|nr:hypothetical protein [Burkholderia stagnalis]KAB0640680.1 hypothetical protein F7R25_04065 [Burkholderia stagnalis]VWB06462.1 hypothetical protein BST28156_00122 [Burkholderia stagnalis]
MKNKQNQINTGAEKYRFSEEELAAFISQLKNMDTRAKTINQLKELISYPKTKSSLNKLLRKHKIPFADSRCVDTRGHIARPGSTHHKLLNLKVDISNMTLEELHKHINCKASVRSLRVICHRHKIQYKKLSNNKGHNHV